MHYSNSFTGCTPNIGGRRVGLTRRLATFCRAAIRESSNPVASRFRNQRRDLMLYRVGATGFEPSRHASLAAPMVGHVHAFLGQLDVSPLGDHPGGGKGSLKQCEFW